MVWVAWFTATACGPLPAVVTGAYFEHPEVLVALQAAPFSTETVPLFWLVA